jgi:hypothetical protein
MHGVKTDRRRGRQADRHTHTDRQTGGRPTDRQADRQTEKQIAR